jgi:tryptophanyl-tRNA synthetase
MKRLLSGIQPSGDLHIGNYFGAINQWKGMLDECEAFCMIVDYHALTSLRDGDALRNFTHQAVLDYVASGLDPAKCSIFVQSDVPEHAELAWILSTVTPMGLLERAHSYKDKVAKGIAANVALFTYPVLMAADILIYNADIVPVGKDQKQHVEMARDIAEKFNHIYGETFKLPEPIIPEEISVVPGTDGQKMSKSYSNTIPLFVSEADLRKLVMGIVTDSAEVEDKKDPNGNTLFELYKLVASEAEILEMDGRFWEGGYGYGEAKKELLRVLISYFEPIWKKRAEIAQQDGYVEEVLSNGAEKVRSVAFPMIQDVRRKVGL